MDGGEALFVHVRVFLCVFAREHIDLKFLPADGLIDNLADIEMLGRKST